MFVRKRKSISRITDELACRGKLNIIHSLVGRPTKNKEENGKQRSLAKANKQGQGEGPQTAVKDKSQRRVEKTFQRINIELLVEKKYCSA